MKCDLINSGFVPKVEKITMETYQTVDLVKFIIDSEAGFFLNS